jgi:hypothetical protein
VLRCVCRCQADVILDCLQLSFQCGYDFLLLQLLVLAPYRPNDAFSSRRLINGLQPTSIHPLGGKEEETESTQTRAIYSG